MGLKTWLEDSATGREGKINEDNALIVTTTGHPTGQDNTILKPYVALMATEAGSTDMLVNGSTTNVDFIIRAGGEYDRHITHLSFTIADAGATLNEFGNIGTLTNGCQLIYQDMYLGDVVIAESIKTNFDMVQLCNFTPAFGSGNDSFRANNVSGMSEAFIGTLDIKKVFGLPFGFKLEANSTKSIILRVRDNVSGIDRFDVKAFGFDRVIKS